MDLQKRRYRRRHLGGRISHHTRIKPETKALLDESGAPSSKSGDVLDRWADTEYARRRRDAERDGEDP